MDKPTILVVDDDPDLLQVIEMRLTFAGYDVVTATSGVSALEVFRAGRPRAVVTDLRMEGMDGFSLFERLHAEAPSLPVIILTAHGTIRDAVRATQRGVFSFITKPFDGQELLARVAEAVAVSPLTAVGMVDAGGEKMLVSSNPAMGELHRQARLAAESSEPIIVLGPRGVGKELLARSIHGASANAEKPFVPLRCGQWSEARSGMDLLGNAIERAGGGVLFLDDVEGLSPAMQVGLLPLLIASGVFAWTARAPGRPSVRVIASTTQPLAQLVRVGRFRSDLFYALSRTSLTVPALADRRDDIPPLVAHFVSAGAMHAGGSLHAFAPEALALLQESPWPGNVRQLRHVVEQALALAVTPRIPAALVARLLREEEQKDLPAFDEARRGFEYDYLMRLLTTTGGNVAQAARLADRNRTEFYKLLARHQLDPAAFKQSGK
jgi:two-component system response regulator GlrR